MSPTPEPDPTASKAALIGAAPGAPAETSPAPAEASATGSGAAPAEASAPSYGAAPALPVPGTTPSSSNEAKAASSTGGVFDVVAVASQVVLVAHEALVAAAQFPDLPPELRVEFLHGVDPSALTAEERDALRLGDAAEKRLQALFDQVQSTLAARKAQSLAKGAKYFDLLGNRSGQKSFADQRSSTSGKGFHAAKTEVLAAQVLDRNPDLQEDIETGALTTDHVAIAAAAIERDSRRNPKPLTAEQEAELLDLGKGKSADQFAKEASRFLTKRSAIGHDATIEEQRAHRYFTYSSGAWGMKFQGQIDAVSAQSLKTALTAIMTPPSPDDDRAPDQRNADALVDLAKTVIDQGTLKAGAHVRPHVSVIMTEQTFSQATKELTRRRTVTQHQTDLARYKADLTQYEADLSQYETDLAQYEVEQARLDLNTNASSPQNADHLPHSHLNGSGPSNANGVGQGPDEAGLGASLGGAPVDGAGLGGAPVKPIPPVKPVPPTPLDPTMLESLTLDPAEYEDGTPIPLNELSMILCDSDLTRIVLNAEGAIMDLGRTERLYTRAHRRAIIARDKGCVFEGCNAAVQHCEIHHIKYWKRDNGDTSIENAALLCRFHHTRVHNDTLEIIKPPTGLPQAILATSTCPTNRGTVPKTAGINPPTNHEPDIPATGPAKIRESGTPPTTTEPPETELAKTAPPSGTPPSAAPPSAAPPSGTPPSAAPPSASSLSAAPPSGTPPSAAPPSASSLSAAPPSASSLSAAPPSASSLSAASPGENPPNARPHRTNRPKPQPHTTDQHHTGPKKKSAKQKVDTSFDLFSDPD